MGVHACGVCIPLIFSQTYIPSHFLSHTSPPISLYTHPLSFLHTHTHTQTCSLSQPPPPHTEDFLLQEQAADIKILSNYVSHLRRVGKGHGVWHFDRYLYENRGALGYDGVVHHLGGHGGANGGGHGGGGIA